MSSLVSRVKSELLDPVAIYRFLDAATKSLTIDSQLGGITGLYNLGQSLRSIPSGKIAFFTIPNYPRADVVPGDTANVLWTQPEDNEIFASFRDDVPGEQHAVRLATSGIVTASSRSQLVTADPSGTPAQPARSVRHAGRRPPTASGEAEPVGQRHRQPGSRSRHGPPTSPSAQADEATGRPRAATVDRVKDAGRAWLAAAGAALCAALAVPLRRAPSARRAARRARPRRAAAGRAAQRQARRDRRHLRPDLETA